MEKIMTKICVLVTVLTEIYKLEEREGVLSER